MSQPVPAQGGKQSLYQRGKNKTADRAVPVIAAALGPSERILIGARVESGPGIGWQLLSTWVVFFRKYYYMALTDHHVVMVRNSKWSGRPKTVESATPRNQVSVSDFTPGVLFSTFKYGYPGRDKPMRLRVHRVFRPEIDSLLGQIGAFGLGPGQPDQYGPPQGQQYPPPGQQYSPPPGQQYGPPPGQQY